MGTPIGRSLVVMMHGGFAAVEWGDGIYLDLQKGTFFTAGESEVSHRAGEADLDWLVRQGWAEGYDANLVYLTGLPELPRHTLA